MTAVELGWLEIQRARYDTHLDQLTGLPTWPLLFDRLIVALARARRTGTMVGVYVIDEPRSFRSEGFLLHSLVITLRGEMRADDTLARIGTERLAMVFGDLREDQDAARLARRLIHHAGVICRLGVALGTGDEGPEMLLAQAIAQAVQAPPT